MYDEEQITSSSTCLWALRSCVLPIITARVAERPAIEYVQSCNVGESSVATRDREARRPNAKVGHRTKPHTRSAKLYTRGSMHEKPITQSNQKTSGTPGCPLLANTRGQNTACSSDKDRYSEIYVHLPIYISGARSSHVLHRSQQPAPTSYVYCALSYQTAKRTGTFTKNLNGRYARGGSALRRHAFIFDDLRLSYTSLMDVRSTRWHQPKAP